MPPSAQAVILPQNSDDLVLLMPVGHAGIGGVHRGGEVSWDVSSDLTEFSKTPVAVVCAGAKSILDIPRTLEFLETQECFIL